MCTDITEQYEHIHSIPVLVTVNYDENVPYW